MEFMMIQSIVRECKFTKEIMTWKFAFAIVVFHSLRKVWKFLVFNAPYTITMVLVLRYKKKFIVNCTIFPFPAKLATLIMLPLWDLGLGLAWLSQIPCVFEMFYWMFYTSVNRTIFLLIHHIMYNHVIF